LSVFSAIAATSAPDSISLAPQWVHVFAWMGMDFLQCGQGEVDVNMAGVLAELI